MPRRGAGMSVLLPLLRQAGGMTGRNTVPPKGGAANPE